MQAIFALTVAVWLLQPSPAALPEATPAQKEAFLRVLKRAPAFAKGNGRELESVHVGSGVAGTDGKAFMAEFGWTEKGTRHTGLAAFTDEAALLARAPNDVSKALAREGGWLLMKVIEDKTWAEMVASLEASRRSLRESAQIGDIQTVMGAQRVYKSVVNAYAPTLACLVRPADCIPGYDGPSDFLAAGIAAGTDRTGYHRTFHPGPTVGTAKARTVQTWAYTAVPTPPGEGARAFCGDHTGVVCASTDGTMPMINDGTCPKTCKAITPAP